MNTLDFTKIKSQYVKNYQSWGKANSVRESNFFSFHFLIHSFFFQKYWPWSKWKSKTDEVPAFMKFIIQRRSHHIDWWVCNYMKQREHGFLRADIRWVPWTVRCQEKLPTSNVEWRSERWIQVEMRTKGSIPDRENNMHFGPLVVQWLRLCIPTQGSIPTN